MTDLAESPQPGELKHWSIELDMDAVAWFTLDRHGEGTNSLSQEVLAELELALDDVEARQPVGLVIRSAKSNGFIAGADVREFDALDDAGDIETRITRVHELFERIERLPMPSVAAIHGFCLGGGLELALACSYRIAEDQPSTRIGFPEVKLGIFPGFGGTARSTALIGGPQAMTLMLTGRTLGARAARAAGLIDELVPAHTSLRWAARRAALQGRRSRGGGRLTRFTNLGPVRATMAPMMRKQVASKANPRHYPAPYRLIEHWRQHGGDKRRMLAGEAKEVAALMVGDTAKGLRRIFLLMEQLKGLGKSDDPQSAWQPRRVHVVGAGVMGGDIAAWCTVQGLEVTLQDRAMEYIEPAIGRARKLFLRKLKTARAVEAAQKRLIADPDGKGAQRADVIIEAIFENRDAKRSLFETLQASMREDALLATNTSAIPLNELSSVLKRPQRLIGLHFFNPVAQMPLVEVVQAEETEAGEVARGCAFATKIGKLPLPVKSAPGFLVNRVLAPYLMEALAIHEQGVSKETIDQAALEFGMPMGPIELADRVGLDVCLNVLNVLGEARSAGARQSLQPLVEAGSLGAKSGAGFYSWEKGKALKEKAQGQSEELDKLAECLIAPMLNECRACLESEIVANADQLDAGVVLGTGFAPFRGGPMRFMESRHQDSKV